MESLHVSRFELTLCSVRRQDQQIHHVLTAQLNDRRGRPADDHIEATAD